MPARRHHEQELDLVSHQDPREYQAVQQHGWQSTSFLSIYNEVDHIDSGRLTGRVLEVAREHTEGVGGHV